MHPSLVDGLVAHATPMDRRDRVAAGTCFALVERDDIDDANNIAVVVAIIGADDANAGRHHPRRHQPQRGLGEAGAPRADSRDDRGNHTQRQCRYDLFGHLLRPYKIDDNNDASDAVDIAGRRHRRRQHPNVGRAERFQPSAALQLSLRSLRRHKRITCDESLLANILAAVIAESGGRNGPRTIKRGAT